MPDRIRDVGLELTPTDRIRSPGDVLRLLTGLVVFVVGVALALYAPGTLGGAEADLERSLSRIPSTWERVMLGIAEAGILAAIIAIALFMVLTRRRRILAWLVTAVVLATALTFLLDWLLTRSRVEVLRGADTVEEWFLSNPNFPSSGLLAGITAALVFGSPWLTSRWRRAGWVTVGALVVLRVGFSADPSVDVVPAIGIGIMIGAGTLLWRGAPSLEPSGIDLVHALRAAGIEPVHIRQVSPVHTTATYVVDCADGDVIRLGMRTQHDRSADVLTHMWQSLRLRSDEVDAPFNTIQQRVEHEALALVLANRSGARVPALVALVGTGEDAVGIAETHLDQVLGDSEAAPTKAQLVDAWSQVRQLHRAGIAHRDLSLASVCLDPDGHTWLTGFHRSRLVATGRERALDVAQLLTDTAVAAGPQGAVDAALEALGPEDCAAAYPLLQPLALPRTTRRSLRDHDGLLDELRQLVQERCGAHEAELANIERVRPRTIVTVLALTLAFYLVLPQLADIRSTATAFANANLAWAPWILVGSALSYIFAAVSFVGAVPDSVPFVPALRAQIASSFVSLIAPANSGALALGVRFLQRSGVDSASAAASVTLDAVAGLVVHIAMLVVFIAWSGSSGVSGFSMPETSWVLGVIAVVLAVIGLSMLHRGLRERVLGPMAKAARTAVTSIGAVVTNPMRVAQLLGGSIGITLAYILAAVAAVEAFGGGPSYTQVAVGYLLASALASVAPTPGGLGAFEAGMIAALTGFGMSSPAAVSATLAFRLATYWLPILPGWFSFTWMQHHGEI